MPTDAHDSTRKGARKDAPDCAPAQPDDPHADCPIRGVLSRVSDRWSLLVIVVLAKRSFRFSELQKYIPDISPRMLSQTLRRLEQDGYVSRKAYPTIPPRVDYSITDLGTTMWDSVGGVLKVLNPVNIYNHLSGANTDPASQPTTVVGITRVSADIGNESGLGGILLILAGVNVFIGLLNMFPLLPFDGGHAAIATYERLRSRKGQPPYRADVGKMIPVTMAVMTLLAFLLVAGLYLDKVRPVR